MIDIVIYIDIFVSFTSTSSLREILSRRIFVADLDLEIFLQDSGHVRGPRKSRWQIWKSSAHVSATAPRHSRRRREGKIAKERERETERKKKREKEPAKSRGTIERSKRESSRTRREWRAHWGSGRPVRLQPHARCRTQACRRLPIVSCLVPPARIPDIRRSQDGYEKRVNVHTYSGSLTFDARRTNKSKRCAMGLREGA